MRDLHRVNEELAQSYAEARDRARSLETQNSRLMTALRLAIEALVEGCPRRPAAHAVRSACALDPLIDAHVTTLRRELARESASVKGARR